MFLISMDISPFEYVEVYLDSRDSINLDSVTGLTDFNTALFRFERPLENIAGFKVLEAEIPFSYLVVSLSDSQFTLTEMGSQTVFIPAGNYTGTQLATTLGTALTTASVALGGYTYTVTYDYQNRGGFYISASGGSWTLSNLSPTLQSVLGMDNGFNSGVLSAAETTKVAQLTGPNYLYINSRKLGGVIATTLPDSAPNGFGAGKGPQIAKIPINVNFWDVIYYQDPMPTRWFATENLLQLDALDLYCTLGRSNEPIDFRGASFSVKIGLYLNKPNTSQLRRF